MKKIWDYMNWLFTECKLTYLEIVKWIKAIYDVSLKYVNEKLKAGKSICLDEPFEIINPVSSEIERYGGKLQYFLNALSINAAEICALKTTITSKYLIEKSCGIIEYLTANYEFFNKTLTNLTEATNKLFSNYSYCITAIGFFMLTKSAYNLYTAANEISSVKAFIDENKLLIIKEELNILNKDIDDIVRRFNGADIIENFPHEVDKLLMRFDAIKLKFENLEASNGANKTKLINLMNKSKVEEFFNGVMCMGFGAKFIYSLVTRRYLSALFDFGLAGANAYMGTQNGNNYAESKRLLENLLEQMKNSEDFKMNFRNTNNKLNELRTLNEIRQTQRIAEQDQRIAEQDQRIAELERQIRNLHSTRTSD